MLLWLVRKALFGHISFLIILLDSGNELAEVYAFRDHYVREWELNYINAKSLPPMSRAAARKTLDLKRLINQRSFRGFCSVSVVTNGQQSAAKACIHPLSAMNRARDLARYIAQETIPVVRLYFARRHALPLARRKGHHVSDLDPNTIAENHLQPNAQEHFQGNRR